MPLFPGKKNIGRNIETEEAHGKPHKQAIAIALDVARRSGAKIPKKRKRFAKGITGAIKYKRKKNTTR
jgi:hypothetical protein